MYALPRLGYVRVRAVLALMGPGRLGRVRPSMGLLRYIQSQNYHFCTRAPVSETAVFKAVRRILPCHFMYFIDFETRIIVRDDNERWREYEDTLLSSRTRH